MVAVRRFLPSWKLEFPAGGFGLWIKTDATVDERRLLEIGIEEGVAFDTGSAFLTTQVRRARTHVRLCYSFAPAARFEEGARRLARAWRRARR